MTSAEGQCADITAEPAPSLAPFVSATGAQLGHQPGFRARPAEARTSASWTHSRDPAHAFGRETAARFHVELASQPVSEAGGNRGGHR